MRTFALGGSTARATLLMTLAALSGCSDRSPVVPEAPSAPVAIAPSASRELAQRVRGLAAQRGITPMPARPLVRDDLRKLGEALVFDPILSGNRDISCMTCHHPDFGLGDDRSLAIGQGATGLGPTRVHPKGAFIPRNAPPLFDLQLLRNLFWDGRVSVDGAGGFHTPAGAQLTPAMTAVFEFGAPSALGLFPVTSREEMRGAAGENELAEVPDDDLQGIWTGLMHRLGSIPRYRAMFEAAYPGTPFEAMTFAHASNAMAGYLISTFTFDNSPWDRFLAGEDRALSSDQLDGAEKFMNAPCSQCHNGPGFTDNDFHDVALAQFGPGKGNGPSGRDDFGRQNVTGDPADAYRFRSTMLRNVELTAPYGHAGQFSSLSAFIDHYSRSADKLLAYASADVPEPLLTSTLLEDDKDAIIAARDPRILSVAFDSVFTRKLTAFMTALTDDRARDLSRFVPRSVPSGLPVDR
jgi:cytochrome c peroxidase